MCLSLTNSLSFEKDEPRRSKMEKMFFPIVKNGKLDEFKEKWSEWFVLSNKLEDEKTPGLLKEEFETQNGEIVALCPKNYQICCYDKGEIKKFLKKFTIFNQLIQLKSRRPKKGYRTLLDSK